MGLFISQPPFLRKYFFMSHSFGKFFCAIWTFNMLYLFFLNMNGSEIKYYGEKDFCDSKNTRFLNEHVIYLTILTGKNCILYNSVQEWLVGCFWHFFIRLHNQLSYLYIPSSRIKEYICLKIWIHQRDSKNEWSLFPASFTSKFGLVFCLNTGKRILLEVSF